MGSIEIILRDDDGNIINQRTRIVYKLGKGLETLHEIEGAVEELKQQALPDIEADYLSAAQAKCMADMKKKTD